MIEAPTQHDIAEAILRAVATRGLHKSICPSEIARSLWTQPSDAWRARMPEVREAAFTLADAGQIAITQRGEIVDGRTARGAIRLRAKA